MMDLVIPLQELFYSRSGERSDRVNIGGARVILGEIASDLLIQVAAAQDQKMAISLRNFQFGLSKKVRDKHSAS